VIRTLPTRIFSATENETAAAAARNIADKKKKAKPASSSASAANVTTDTDIERDSTNSDDSSLEMGPLLAHSDRSASSSSSAEASSDSAVTGDVKIDMPDADEEHKAELEQVALNCAICLQDFVDGDELRILPCTHEFHVACVDQWLVTKKTCPLCRKRITDQGFVEDAKDGKESKADGKDIGAAAAAVTDSPSVSALDESSASAVPLLDVNHSSSSSSSSSPSSASAAPVHSNPATAALTASASARFDRRRAEDARRRLMREPGMRL